MVQAEAQELNARNNLSYTEVKSPTDGVVGMLPYRAGALVSASIPQPLTTISDNSNMYVYFSMTENQMLAMSRALMSHPKLLMLDEPSMGLAPILVEQIFDIVRELHAAGTTILLVEQNAQAALSVADRAYVLETGRITLSGTGKELMASDAVRKAYLGG